MSKINIFFMVLWFSGSLVLFKPARPVALALAPRLLT